MKLSQLLQRDVTLDIPVSNVKDDSRLVEDGDIFVFDCRVIKGGEKFVKMALEKGAKVVVTNLDFTPENVPQNTQIIYHHNPGGILAKWAKLKFPKTPKVMVGVTGTNGKTSVAHFYSELMKQTGANVATIGTLGMFVNGEKLMDTGYTAPTALKLHEILSALAKQGVKYCCMEVSSHALELGRTDGVDFDSVAITNITQDHLDFHGTMQNYATAKMRLFSERLKAKGVAIVNVNHLENLPATINAKQAGASVITVGTASAELVVGVKSQSAKGMHVEVKYGDNKWENDLPLIGSFQAENLAVALGLAISSGLDIRSVPAGLAGLTGVPGRMELIKSSKNQPAVVVDYAHTPDALENALKALRPFAKGKLNVLFGCGGDRDVTKRPKMGEIAARLADYVVVTDDNPRSEDAEFIRQQILSSCPSAKNIADRRKAIHHIITQSEIESVTLIAGKGHEKGQIIGDKIYPFDDREECAKVLNSMCS